MTYEKEAEKFSVSKSELDAKPARRIPLDEEPGPEKTRLKKIRSKSRLKSGSAATGDHTLTVDTVEEDKPWRRQPEALDDDRIVAFRSLSDESNHQTIREQWRVTTDMEIINNAPGEDLIWANSREDLVVELRSRNRAPEGFTYVRQPYAHSDEISVHRHLVRRTGEEPTPAQIMAAVAEGNDLSHAKFMGDALLKECGYTESEIAYLTNRSRLKTLPLKDGLVLRWKGRGYGYRDYTVDLDEEDFSSSLESLKHSRRTRKKSKKGKILKQTKIVTDGDIRAFGYEIFTVIGRRTKMPSTYIVRYEGLGAMKGSAAGILIGQMVPWYEKVIGNKSYRKLGSYQLLIKTWADERNRAKTHKASERNMSVNCDLKPMLKFMEWLDAELAYCRKRGWKFAKDPMEEKPKKKKKGK